MESVKSSWIGLHIFNVEIRSCSLEECTSRMLMVEGKEAGIARYGCMESKKMQYKVNAPRRIKGELHD